MESAPISTAPERPPILVPLSRADFAKPIGVHAATQVGCATLLGLAERIGIPAPFALVLLAAIPACAMAAWMFVRIGQRSPSETEQRWLGFWATLASPPLALVMFLAYLLSWQGLDGLDLLLDVRSVVGGIPAEIRAHPIAGPLLALVLVGGTGFLNYWCIGAFGKWFAAKPA